MTIDEAIELHKKDATIITNGDNHQIAEWLEELKLLREKAKGDKWYQKGRADVINELLSIENPCDNCYMEFCESCGRNGEYSANIQTKLDQLKEQKNEPNGKGNT